MTIFKCKTNKLPIVCDSVKNVSEHFFYHEDSTVYYRLASTQH